MQSSGTVRDWGVKEFDAVRAFARHISATRFDHLPSEAVERAKTFLLDTVGVGLAGTSDANAARVLSAAAGWGEGQDASVWGHGVRLPAPSAAFVNAYLVHALEFDCIHERAVVHPMATLIASPGASARPGAAGPWTDPAS